MDNPKLEQALGNPAAPAEASTSGGSARAPKTATIAGDHGASNLRPQSATASVARASALPWLLFFVALAAAVWGLWKAYGPDSKVDPSGISAVTLQKQNRLIVLKARLSTVTVRTDKRLFGMLESAQIAVIPATVDYYLDFSGVGKERVSWNPEDQALNVRLPDVRVAQPNLDVEHARYFRKGVWITGEAQEVLYKLNAQAARRQAVNAATSSLYLQFARDAARGAVQQNLAIPLRVAGFGKVTVNVLFDGEKETTP